MIDLQERDFDLVKGISSEALLKTVPSERDFRYIIEKSSFVNLEGKKPLVYLDLQDVMIISLWKRLNALSYTDSNRHGKVTKIESLLFGATSPIINKLGFCNAGVVTDQDPILGYLLCEKISGMLDKLFAHYLPGWQQVNHSLTKKSNINLDYFMSQTIWTSGILNKSSIQPYHFDVMNLKNTYSAMFTIKHRMSGGYLVLPEYDLAVKAANGSVIFFCGRELLHGVSPMKIHPGGERFTGVYYTTKSLEVCGSKEEEQKKALNYEKKAN